MPEKPNRHFTPQPSARSLRSISAATLALCASAHAANITLSGTGDGIGTSSFSSTGVWSPSVAPSPGNAYFVPTGATLRTPSGSAASHTFAGDSLALNGGTFNYKGITNVNTVTINNLTFNGGLVNNASDGNLAFIFGGSITVTGTGTSRIFANNGAITVTAPIGGNSGTLQLDSNSVAGRQVILSAANTYSGTILVSGGSGAVLAPEGSLTFVIGATGISNAVTGTAPMAFNGAFVIDLTSAGNAVGNSWTLVAASLVETYGETFSIQGFIENNGIWTSPSGTYQFKESTGVLSRISTDTDGDGLPDTWEMTHFGSLAQGAEDGFDAENNPVDGDFDDDLASNLLEYENSSIPTNPASYPDTDDDGLNDGWEDFYFENLAQLGGGDPDGDFSSNSAEHLGGTDPSFGGNFPDTDNSGAGDGISDGWEIFYFATIAACDPAADFDGDFFSNDLEFAARTHPKNQESSPDTDNFTGDGLADGWEVKHFGQPGDTLESAIARQSGTDDFDGDGYSNAVEFSLHTSPADPDSVPGPVAWWRYEEATTGPVAAGNGGEAAFNNVVLDSSAGGNHMRTYNGMPAPAYSTDVPFTTVPLGGEINTASLYFDGAQDGTWLDLVYTDVGAPVRSMTFTGWTIEASFKMDSTTGYQVVFSKDGNPLGGQPPFSMKFRDPDKKFEVGIVDGAGVARYASSLGTLSAGQWYSVAATANATTLSLWLKGPGDSAYVLQESTAISGAFFNTFGGLNDAWAAGRGRWNGGETDLFKGYIDEVRISAAALSSDKFLASSAIVDTDGDGMDDNWELAHFADPLLPETAEGDFDKDGTSNIAEYLLGLDPKSGSSRFAVSGSGAMLSWSAAAGRVFTVQRSTTLGGWEDKATVTATGPTASWTDPAPPAGTAFYRVVLDTD